MARIRAIKPEFWSSPGHPANPWSRLLYIAMWNWADDVGVGTANLRELAGFAFPNDDHIDVGAMRRLCADISAHYGVLFYTVADRPYYAIPTWRHHQKFDSRRTGKHPGPDDAETWLYQDVNGESAQCADGAPTLRPHVGALGTPEQGNRGTGEQGNYLGVPVTSRASELPADESPHRCELHRGVAAPPPCRDCGDIRESAVDHTAAEIARRTRERDLAARIARTEIDACDLCGDDGYRLDRAEVCNHRPVDTSTARQRIAEMRATLAKKETA